MKRQRLIKVLFAILYALIIIGLFTPIVYGSIDTSFLTDIGIDKGYVPMVKKGLGVVQYICYAAAVIITMIIGVRFMSAAPEGKAEVKKQSIYMAIGAGILFAIGLIGSIVSNVSTTIFPG